MKAQKIFAGFSAAVLAGTMAASVVSAAPLKTIKGTTDEKVDFWDDEHSYFIDTTGYDRSKIDKIVVEYSSDAIWCNGKVAGNINLDKNTSTGNWKGFEWTTPKGGESGECLLWDLKDGKPQYNDNPISGENFKVKWDVNSKKGSVEWSNIIKQGGLFDGRYSKGTKKYNKAKDVYTAAEGDAAGVVLQIGTMSNIPVVPESEKDNPDYKATKWTPAKFEITKVTIYDKNGKVLTKGSSGGSSSSTLKVGSVAKVKASSTSKSVKLSWSKVSGATGYKVYKYDTAKKKYVLIKKTSATSLTVKKVSPAKKYTYTVQAYKKSGSKVAYSTKVAKVALYTAPAAPSQVKITKSKTVKNAAAVSWKKSSTKGVKYKVYVKTTKKGTPKLVATTNSTKYTYKKAKKGKTYYFTVKAVKKLGSKTYASDFAALKSYKAK